MNRTDFQRLAELRLIEGKALLDAGHFVGACYLLGYAVECALKACIAKRTNLHDFPPKRNVVEDVYSHNLSKLLTQSGLEASFLQACRTDKTLDINWATVKLWSEESRYDLATSSSKANDLYIAVSQPGSGVFPWLMNSW
ncbi:MAG: HEPN domain-containing protein [Chloroflexi bacterium]|nr:HEPN domain-containing protein [Chloroflexota bacterium]